MVSVKHSRSTKRPISILANTPRDRAMSRGVELGPRPPRPPKPPKDSFVVGNVTIARFDDGIEIMLGADGPYPYDEQWDDLSARPRQRLRLTESDYEELVVVLDRVLEAKITKPSPPPRPAPTNQAGHANRALVKVGP